MIAYYGSAISNNISVTPEGYLICRNVPIARTGIQEYLPEELGLEGEGICRVYRAESEVFSPATMASFEGKPVTLDHPAIDVDASNVAAFTKGHLQNVRRGVGQERDLLIADLFIVDPSLIEQVRSGKLREVSCGYRCEYVADETGQIFQRSIRGNHVAVVAAGRAGSRVAIRDSIPKTPERGNRKMANRTKKSSLFAQIFSGWAKDADPDEVANAVDELMEQPNQQDEDPAPAPASQPAPKDTEPAQAAPAASEPSKDTDPVIELLTKLCTKLDAVLAKEAVDDDPLTKLEKDLGAEPSAEPATPGDTDPTGEESVTVPAEQINGQDEEADPQAQQDEEAAPVAPESEKPQNPIQGADSAAILAAIGAIKPLIASLPAEKRRAASDAAARKIRAAMGLDAKPRKNGYSAIAANTRKAAARDSGVRRKVVDEAQLGRDIMAKRNPHYQNKEGK